MGKSSRRRCVAASSASICYGPRVWRRTANQISFIRYIDPDTHAVRTYYPDFLFLRDEADGTKKYETVEVKADNRIDGAVVQAETEFAPQLAMASGTEYRQREAISCLDVDLRHWPARSCRFGNRRCRPHSSFYTSQSVGRVVLGVNSPGGIIPGGCGRGRSSRQRNDHPVQADHTDHGTGRGSQVGRGGSPILIAARDTDAVAYRSSRRLCVQRLAVFAVGVDDRTELHGDCGTGESQ